MNKIYQKTFPALKNAGFTLIELLVVVLIIGILAAVALPKYQVAVEKSRLASVMAAVRSIKDQAEVYYIANGSYPPDNATALDSFDLPEGCSLGQDSGSVKCTHSIIDLGVGTGNASSAVLGVTKSARSGNITGYVMFLNNSGFAPGEAECWAAADSAVGNQVCKSMNGTLDRSFAFSWFEGGNANAYRLK